MAFELEILSPDKIIMKGYASEVVAPSEEGEVDIYPGHTDYLTLLGPGRILYREGGKAEKIQITGGVAVVEHDRMTLLVDV